MAGSLHVFDKPLYVTTVDESLAKYFQGDPEIETFEAGDDLKTLRRPCPKNPGHADFIPIKEFKVTDLPLLFQDEDIFKLIKAKADITAKISCRHTSASRPEFYPSSKAPFPFYNLRGTDTLKVGTGKIDIIFPTDNESAVCSCWKCRNSEKKNRKRGEIRMITARHVVYDDIEAEQTKCWFFFDDAGDTRVALDGTRVIQDNTDADFTIFECVTCDAELVDLLYRKLSHYEDLWVKVNNKFKDVELPQTMAVVVSHPHGCSKHVTVGKWFIRVEENHLYTKFAYTASTCPGSSGAEVFLLGTKTTRCFEHVHGGSACGGINFSGMGLEDMKFDD